MQKKSKPLKIKGNALPFILPAALLMTFVVFYPMIFAIVTSLYNWNYIRPDKMSFILFSNYWKALHDIRFGKSIFTTIIYTVGTVVPSIFFGLLLALILQRLVRFKSIIRALLLIPMMMAPVAVGLTWKVFFWDKYFGLTNYVLKFFGIDGPSWLAYPDTAVICIILTSIWKWIPFSMLVIEAALDKLPESPFEAAKLDGANRWQSFWFLTMPMIKSPLWFVILIRTTTDFRTFDVVQTMTDGGPGLATTLVSLFIYFSALREYKIGYANCLAIIMTIIIALVCVVLLFFMRRKVGAEALWEE